ncbi:MAG: nitric oxide reductase activation-like protein [Eubacteriaceae bacterium]|nr:nitric oxide reductase activation-like protein [Eubacteriaceae bacterium]
MDWIYSDYDMDSRLKNIMWTVSGDYSEDLEKFEEYSKLSKDLAIYYAAKAGARRKFINWKMIKGYLNYRIKKGASPEVIIDVAELVLDQIVEEKLIRERPGIVEIREAGYDELLKSYYITKHKTLMDQVRYAIFFHQTGKSVQMDREVMNIVQDIENTEEISDTLDGIKKIEDIYTKHFQGIKENIDFLYEDKEKSAKILEEFSDNIFSEEYDFNDFMLDEFYGDGEDVAEAIERISSSLIVESMGKMNEDPMEASDKRVIAIDEEMAAKIYDRIEYYYGKSFMNKEEIMKTEKKVCRNAHEGCRVHFTDGILRTLTDNSFQMKYVARQKENNTGYYNNNARVYKRNIYKLKESIIRTLRMEEEVTSIPSEYGVIVPNRLWKVGRTHNYKVFNKILNNQKGGYVVEILLDASGSQRSRQGKVAAQGYIISQALTLAGIPNRVMSFSSFLDYTILRRFRDYNSPESENKNIFEYYSTGNNRDGLAIRAACEGIYKREEEHKILIILSDGKPNDIKISKTSTIRGETSYKGMKAIKDTAMEVRQARKNGVLVMGVFTGKEEDLSAEKFIYGKDFIYTRNIEKFSDIVGMLLKRIIENY